MVGGDSEGEGKEDMSAGNDVLRRGLCWSNRGEAGDFGPCSIERKVLFIRGVKPVEDAAFVVLDDELEVGSENRTRFLALVGDLASSATEISMIGGSEGSWRRSDSEAGNRLLDRLLRRRAMGLSSWISAMTEIESSISSTFMLS